MRKLGFAVLGLLAGAGIALALALLQPPGAREMDPQGMHLMGVVFVALPVGAVVGLILGLLAGRVLRR